LSTLAPNKFSLVGVRYSELAICQIQD